jgi:hypothetical protein
MRSVCETLSVPSLPAGIFLEYCPGQKPPFWGVNPPFWTAQDA